MRKQPPWKRENLPASRMSPAALSGPCSDLVLSVWAATSSTPFFF